MQIDPSSFKGRPRRWYWVPMVAGLLLFSIGVLGWFFPRFLLFLVCFPLIVAGIALMLFALDLWRGVPQGWRERVHTVHMRVWPGNRDQEL